MPVEIQNVSEPPRILFYNLKHFLDDLNFMHKHKSSPSNIWQSFHRNIDDASKETYRLNEIIFLWNG